MKFFKGVQRFFFVSQVLSFGFSLSFLGSSALARQPGPAKMDPFDCAGSLKCNASALLAIEQKGFKSLGYDEARMQIYHKIDVYTENGTNYIDCVYSKDRIEEPVRGLPDSNHFNTEHTVPQSYLKTHPESALSRADLHHLFPAGSKINGIRGSYPFGECETKDDTQGILCPGGHSFMPPVKQRGATARAVFYMSIMYSLPVDDREEVVLRKWNEKYPPNAYELKRDFAIQQTQGNANPFVSHPEWVSLISDY